MVISYVWTGMIVFSVVFGILSGNISAVSEASMTGASEAIKLCIATGGMICLWSGVMELMQESGLSSALSKLLAPLLRVLFPTSCRDRETRNALSENMTANLLGLGNAATPAGIRAVEGMIKQAGSEACEKELTRLVVLNTASIQLVPTTIAAIRSASGAENAFDILPAVWLSSLISVSVGLLAARLLERKRR